MMTGPTALWLAAALTLAAAASAQVGQRIYGKVLDEDGQPVEGAEVIIETLALGTQHRLSVETDKKGRYRAVFLHPARDYMFQIRKDGFLPHDELVELGLQRNDPNIPITRDFRLRRGEAAPDPEDGPAPAQVAAGQVAARQGASSEKHFASPMILELPLPNVDRLQEGSTVRLADVQSFICDRHVTLIDLTVTKRYKGRKKARTLELVLSGLVHVAPSYDRRIDLAVNLRSGEEVFSSETLSNRSAEERRSMPFQVLLGADESGLAAAMSSDKPPVLELTLTVRDDS